MILPPLFELAKIANVKIIDIEEIYYLEERGELFHHLTGEPNHLKNYLHLIIGGDTPPLTLSLIGYNVHNRFNQIDHRIEVTPSEDCLVQAIHEAGEQFKQKRFIQTEDCSFSIECVYRRDVF